MMFDQGPLAVSDSLLSSMAFIPDARVHEYFGPRLDRELGYIGERNYVMFYYDPRGEEVMWDDGQRSGLGYGAWMFFLEHIVPAARQCGVSAGSESGFATHALLLDRSSNDAWFVPLSVARQLVRRQQ